MNKSRIRVVSLVGVIFVSLFLMACSSGEGTTQFRSESPQSPQEDISSSKSSPTTTSEFVGQVPDTSCEQVITPNDLYSYNSNFSLINNQSGQETIEIGESLMANAIQCTYKNLSSETTIQLTITQLTGENEPSVLEKLNTSGLIDASNSNVYFGVADISNDGGTGYFISNGFLLIVSSTFFTTLDEMNNFSSLAINNINNF